MGKTGSFFGVPYDWRRPTVARFRQRWWNLEDPRLFTPKAWGWGFDLNLARLLRRRPGSQHVSSQLPMRCTKQR